MKLTEIPANFTVPGSNINSVLIEGNPLKCDCSIESLARLSRFVKHACLIEILQIFLLLYNVKKSYTKVLLVFKLQTVTKYNKPFVFVQLYI